MAIDLDELVAVGRAAVVTMELQRGVVGDLSSFPALADAVRQGQVVEHAARLVGAARRAAVPVVHCTAGFRADRLGSKASAPLITAMLRRPEHLLEGTPAVELVPELGPEDGDLVSHRRHGVSPFVGTSLDATLRSLGVETVVAAGVSLNLGIIGLAVEAVNFGYHVVVATDAVAGIPPDYAQAVLEHTLALVATLADVDRITAAWVV
ncbi:MAG TPA: cysteine hydrolase [Acidimicrobiales bacterium]|nr:cysteine hydrolase [Acidimicrobiales bacterium]